MNPVETTLCKLYQHPEQYAGKMIKVRAGSVGDLRIGNILHDSRAEACTDYMRIIVTFPERVKPAPAFDLIRDESYRKLEDALHGPGLVHIDATYEGRFDAAFVWRDRKRTSVGREQLNGFGDKDEYDGRIVLRRVSDVWTMRLAKR